MSPAEARRDANFMNNVSVSVITITRNNLAELRGTLESVRAQDHASMEVIVVDGASTDGTPDFLRSLDQTKVKWISEPDQGISDAYNKGVDPSSGDLCIFMNSGDEFVSAQTIGQTVALIPNEAKVTDSVIYGDFYQVLGSECNYTQADHTKLHSTCSLNHQSAFVGRNIGRRFRFDLRLRLEADYDVWLRMLSAGVPFIKVDLPIARFHLGGISSGLKYRVHILVIRYFLIALNTRKMMTVGDTFVLCFRAVLTQLSVSLRKLVGRRMIRLLKRFR
jgi:glycosyltransferase involved in cell wall biosynthesis